MKTREEVKKLIVGGVLGLFGGVLLALFLSGLDWTIFGLWPEWGGRAIVFASFAGLAFGVFIALAMDR